MYEPVHAALLNEVRYAERLCQRTARMYRRLQAAGVFFTVLGGSGALAAGSAGMPPVFLVLGAVLFAVFGALLLAVRPADRAAQNEADVRRYARLRTDALGLDAAGLKIALAKARESDAPEVEPLRDVAWNDVVVECGNPGQVVPLGLKQRLLAALA